MKTPRVKDFDPNAKEPVLKSSFENMPAIEKPLTNHEAKKKHTQIIRSVPPTPSTDSGKRVIKQRHPFDIFLDQYEALRDFSLEEKKGGAIGSMSAMVRDALVL